jgi:hypothetical protein
MPNLDEIAQQGCIVCRVFLGVYTDAHIHHLRCDVGMGQKSKRVIPLCPEHHQHGGYGVAFHAGKKAFEDNFCTEEQLWELSQEILHNGTTEL